MAKKSRRSTSEAWPQGKPLWVTPLPPDVPGAWFDQAAVDKVLRALRALRHTKAKWAGTPFEPEPWQIEHIIAPVFGWKHPDGTRIIRTVWIEIPRKNGKSTLASGLALVLLCADGEAGAEVYSAAGSRDQAKIVFDAAKAMARGTPRLAEKLKFYAGSIAVPKTGSKYLALSRLAETAHGLNVHGALIDEVHVHKSRHLIDAIETGTGAREQPLVIFITTADEGDNTTIYAEKHEYAIQSAKGLISDPTFYGAIWAADEQDDPFAESTWRQANPGLGVTVRLDYLRKEANRAQSTPSYLPTFLRLSLNRRVRSESRYLNLRDWDATAGLVVADRLHGRHCYGGLDLSSSTDLTSLVLVFPDDEEPIGYEALACFWMPADNILEKSKRDKVQYQAWIDQGFIAATPGNVIDDEAIRKKIKDELGEHFDIREIGYDRWGAQSLAPRLVGDGFPMFPIAQNFSGLSAPTKELEKLVLQARLRHGGNPVLRWCVDNTVVDVDPAENMKPNKAKSRGRIDGVVALIMAVDRASRHQEGRSVYEGDPEEWAV
jgi:phage terminase large subunit-like protein